jgi:hypothetical protein
MLLRSSVHRLGRGLLEKLLNADGWGYRRQCAGTSL